MKVEFVPHWCDQKTISLPRTWACHTLFWESRAFFLHQSHQWAAWAQPHVKRPDSPGRGWLIAPQSLSSSPDKETLDYSPGSKCWTHALPSREREGERERMSRDLRRTRSPHQPAVSFSGLCGLSLATNYCIHLYSVMGELVPNNSDACWSSMRPKQM